MSKTAFVSLTPNSSGQYVRKEVTEYNGSLLDYIRMVASHPMSRTVELQVCPEDECPLIRDRDGATVLRAPQIDEDGWYYVLFWENQD